jgi:hypothetical protein
MNNNFTMISTYDYNEAQEALFKLQLRQDDINVMEIKAKEMEIDLKNLYKEWKSEKEYMNSMEKQKITYELMVYQYNIQKRGELESFRKIAYAKKCLEYLKEFRCYMDAPDDRLPLTTCCWDDNMGSNCNSLIDFLNKNCLEDIETIIGHGFSADDIIGVAHIQALAPFRKIRLTLKNKDGEQKSIGDSHTIFLANSRFYNNEYNFTIEDTIEMVPNDEE